MDTRTLAANLTQYIINPIIALLFAAGLLVFIWGIVQFLWGLSESGEAEGKEQGKKHMIWGIVGMFIMASAYAILQVIGNTVGTPLPSGGY